MTIDKTLNGNELYISLHGSLDTITSPDLEEVIRKELKEVKLLTIDLKDVDYVSSAGLRVFLLAEKTMDNQDGKLVVLNAAKEIMDVFELTGFSNVLDIR